MVNLSLNINNDFCSLSTFKEGKISFLKYKSKTEIECYVNVTNSGKVYIGNIAKDKKNSYCDFIKKISNLNDSEKKKSISFFSEIKNYFKITNNDKVFISYPDYFSSEDYNALIEILSNAQIPITKSFKNIETIFQTDATDSKFLSVNISGKETILSCLQTNSRKINYKILRNISTHEIDLLVLNSIIIPYIKENYNVAKSFSNLSKRIELNKLLFFYARKIRLGFNFKQNVILKSNFPLAKDDNACDIKLDLKISLDDFEQILGPKYLTLANEIESFLNNYNKNISKIYLYGSGTDSQTLRRILRQKLDYKLDWNKSTSPMILNNLTLLISRTNFSAKQEEKRDFIEINDNIPKKIKRKTKKLEKDNVKKNPAETKQKAPELTKKKQPITQDSKKKKIKIKPNKENNQFEKQKTKKIEEKTEKIEEKSKTYKKKHIDNSTSVRDILINNFLPRKENQITKKQKSNENSEKKSKSNVKSVTEIIASKAESKNYNKPTKKNNQNETNNISLQNKQLKSKEKNKDSKKNNTLSITEILRNTKTPQKKSSVRKKKSMNKSQKPLSVVDVLSNIQKKDKQKEHSSAIDSINLKKLSISKKEDLKLKKEIELLNSPQKKKTSYSDFNIPFDAYEFRLKLKECKKLLQEYITKKNNYDTMFIISWSSKLDSYKLELDKNIGNPDKLKEIDKKLDRLIQEIRKN